MRGVPARSLWRFPAADALARRWPPDRGTGGRGSGIRRGPQAAGHQGCCARQSPRRRACIRRTRRKALTYCEAIRHAKTSSGRQQVPTGMTTTWCSRHRPERQPMPRTCGAPSAGWSRRPGWTPGRGLPANCGTASSRCSPTPESRSSRSRGWSGTAGPRPRKRSTASRSARRSPMALTSWTGSSLARGNQDA